MPTAVPTATATLISAALPPLPTPIPVGVEDNPLRIVVKPVGSAAAARNSATDFEQAVIAQSGGMINAVQVILVERYAEALAAVCDSDAEHVSVAWLDGPTYVAATAQNCGRPMLQVERGSGRNQSTGQAVELIANRDLGISGVGPLSGRTFCRLSAEDFVSWLAPSLMLRANGIDPVDDLGTITDFENQELPALVNAVAAGDCDAAGIPEGALEAFEDELEEGAADGVRIVATSVEFPYAILMYPTEMPLGMPERLTDALLAIAEDNDGAETLEPLLGQETLLRAEPDDFTELVEFMSTTGLDFAQLGR